nr:hypothetical protein [Tanacetum cinerariifolium]
LCSGDVLEFIYCSAAEVRVLAAGVGAEYSPAGVETGTPPEGFSPTGADLYAAKV